MNEFDTIGFMLNNALEYLNNKKYADCKKNLEKAIDEYKKYNLDNELAYLKDLEDSLK